MNNFDIAIIGGGIVGLVLASLLDNHNKNNLNTKFNILLIDNTEYLDKKDYNNNGSPDLRMSALTLKSEQILRDLINTNLLKSRVGFMSKICTWEDNSNQELIFDSKLIAQNYLALIIENNYLLSNLYNNIITSDNITILRPCGIQEIISLNNKSIIISKDLINNTIYEHQAELIIGADGANSWLRKYFNFDVKVEPYGHNGLVTTVYTEKEHYNIGYQCFMPTGPLAFLPWQESNCCSIVWSQDSNIINKLLALEEQDFKLELEKHIQHKLGKIIKIDKRAAFPLVKRHVNNYYKNNCVLIGDAAHTIHPLAGQGLNLGLYDADELAKLLIKTKQQGLNLNNQIILKQFELNRKGHNSSMLALMDFFKYIYEQNNAIVNFARNAGVTAINKSNFIKKQVCLQAAGYN